MTNFFFLLLFIIIVLYNDKYYSCDNFSCLYFHTHTLIGCRFCSCVKYTRYCSGDCLCIVYAYCIFNFNLYFFFSFGTFLFFLWFVIVFCDYGCDEILLYHRIIVIIVVIIVAAVIG